MQNITPYGGDAGQRIAHALTGFGMTILDLRKAYDNLQFQRETEKQQYELQLRAAQAREEATRADADLRAKQFEQNRVETETQFALERQKLTEVKAARESRETAEAGEAAHKIDVLNLEREKEQRIAQTQKEEGERKRVGAVLASDQRRLGQLDSRIEGYTKLLNRPQGADLGALVQQLGAANPNLRTLIGPAQADPSGPAAQQLRAQAQAQLDALQQERARLAQSVEQNKTRMLEYGVDVDSEPTGATGTAAPEPTVETKGASTMLRSSTGASFLIDSSTKDVDLGRYFAAVAGAEGHAEAEALWNRFMEAKGKQVPYPRPVIEKLMAAPAAGAPGQSYARTRGIGGR